MRWQTHAAHECFEAAYRLARLKIELRFGQEGTTRREGVRQPNIAIFVNGGTGMVLSHSVGLRE